MMRRAAITCVSSYVPDNVLTNKDLEKMVETNDEWITSRTGIKERHILKEPGKATSDMGAAILNGIIEKSGLHVDEIDLLICATITPDYHFPDTANTILDKCGCKNAFGFDINAACSGFLYALTTGAKYVESGMCKNVVVIGADKMSSIIDYTDRTTCIIFGDGGGGVLLNADDNYGVLDSLFRGDGSGREFLHMKAGGSLKPANIETVVAKEHYVYQEGKAVFKSAVNGMSTTVQEVMSRNELITEDIEWLVPHQANIRIINSVASMLDFPLERVMINIHKYGNTTAGTLPLCLADYEKRLKKGDKIILTAFGGGFTWGTTYLTWAYDSQ